MLWFPEQIVPRSPVVLERSCVLTDYPGRRCFSFTYVGTLVIECLASVCLMLIL